MGSANRGLWLRLAHSEHCFGGPFAIGNHDKRCRDYQNFSELPFLCAKERPVIPPPRRQPPPSKLEIRFNSPLETSQPARITKIPCTATILLDKHQCRAGFLP